MRYVITVFLLALSLNGLAQAQHPQTFTMPSSLPGGDSVTVKQYFFVMLTHGKEVADKAELSKLQAGHMANIERLHKEGKLVIAGPFGDDKWAGLFVFDCDTKEEVDQLLATDPMIKSGHLGYEIHPWWTGMNAVFK